MANATPTQPGQNNGAGDAEALFYKLFTGEVLAAFDEKNVMNTRHRIRNIQNQKSASFANTGKAYGSIHTPGAEILGQQMKHSETVIAADELLISPVFIADIYEAMNHYDVRRDYSWQCGQALARTFDKSVLRVAATSARSANKITGLPGGTTINLTAGFDAATREARAIEFAEALFQAHQNFVEDDVMVDNAFALITPAMFFALVQYKDLLNVDWGGLGSYGKAELPMVGGLPLVVTNHLPSQDDAANLNGDLDVVDGGDIVPAKYADDYSALRGIVMTPEACGTVKLIDTSVRGDWDNRRQGTLIVARQAVGHGVLRPECAQEIVVGP